MNLLTDFEAPEITRLVWHSRQAQATWEPKINRLSAAFARAERESVGVLRSTGQVWVPVHEYLEMIPWAHSRGLYLKVRRWTGQHDGFAHHYPEGSTHVVVLVSADKINLEWEQPELAFGYPQCCQDWFGQVFPKYVDPIWQWAGGNDPSIQDLPARRITTVADAMCNPVLRYIGVRAVPWIPCSPSCFDTRARSLGWMAMVEKCGGHSEDTHDLLSLPVTWDCYRGVAIVTTEHFRVVVGSVPTAVPYKVRIEPWGLPSVLPK